jgi:hypothetical protein
MSAEPLTAAISLEAGLRLQYEAITKQLPGAVEDEEDCALRKRSEQLGG